MHDKALNIVHIKFLSVLPPACVGRLETMFSQVCEFTVGKGVPPSPVPSPIRRGGGGVCPSQDRTGVSLPPPHHPERTGGTPHTGGIHPWPGEGIPLPPPGQVTRQVVRLLRSRRRTFLSMSLLVVGLIPGGSDDAQSENPLFHYLELVSSVPIKTVLGHFCDEFAFSNNLRHSSQSFTCGTV